LPVLKRILRYAVVLTVGLAAASVGWVALYRVVPPPATLLMLIRSVEGTGITKDWTGLDGISPHLVRAVIGAEDSRFCRHGGFDWDALQDAWEDNQSGGRMRGGSTISMQTAKNAFLWPGRTYVRKGVEAWFTFWLELLWPKARTMEIYLNIVEWGDGIYGAEAAARSHFRKSAADLTRREAAMLAAVLPNPRRWSPASPTRYIGARANVIQQRMQIVERDGLAGCVR
jgi:monofunctional biosynthetic peptidoglycan transglycosylase